MTAASMRFSEHPWRMLAAALLLALAALPAWAHKSSDAYLQLRGGPQGTELRWDIALRDLDAALDLDADGDGRLTWGEIKAAWPRIEAHALARLHIAGCPLHAAGRGLEQRADGAYAVLRLASACALPARPRIDYALLRDVDPTHRGLLKIERPGQGVELVVLDPTVPAATVAGASSADGPPRATPSPAS